MTQIADKFDKYVQDVRQTFCSNRRSTLDCKIGNIVLHFNQLMCLLMFLSHGIVIYFLRHYNYSTGKIIENDPFKTSIIEAIGTINQHAAIFLYSLNLSSTFLVNDRAYRKTPNFICCGIIQKKSYYCQIKRKSHQKDLILFYLIGLTAV